MKKNVVLLLATLVAVTFASCKPKIHYKAGCDVIYIETPEGPKYGVESNGIIRIQPEWDKVFYDVLGENYIVQKNGVERLFTFLGEALCDSVPLITGVDPEFLKGGGIGVPGYYAQARTVEGIFALYYDKLQAEWYQYGPFLQYRPFTSGYAFQDPITKKWGVARYGEWNDNGGNSETKTMDVKWRFSYKRNDVIIQPLYEEVKCVVRPSGDDPSGGRRGFCKKSDITWQAKDASGRWLNFNFDGNPIK